MKKQILILVLALFVIGLSQSVAQINLPPTPLGDCIDLENPLTPVAGQPYTYSVDVPTPPGTKTYHWLVTQDIQFIQNGNLTATPEQFGTSAILASGSGHYNTPTVDANSVELTWQSFILNPGEFVFVVIYVENEDDCTTNNLKVYRIEPLHAFTLDIANVDFAAGSLGDDDLDQCADDVHSAHFDPAFGDNGGVVYDYGTNTLYYVVAAANFSGGYQLSVQFTGLQQATPQGVQGQSAMIYWDNVLDGEGNSSGPIDHTNNGETLILGVVQAQNSPVGQDGEMLYIKIVISHNSFEAANNMDSYAYSFAIDGVLVDGDNNPLAYDDFGDIHHATCTQDPFHDVANQVLKARPTIESQTGNPPGDSEFLPIAP
jgi:hypothetical protein